MGSDSWESAASPPAAQVHERAQARGQSTSARVEGSALDDNLSKTVVTESHGTERIATVGQFHSGRHNLSTASVRVVQVSTQTGRLAFLLHQQPSKRSLARCLMFAMKPSQTAP